MGAIFFLIVMTVVWGINKKYTPRKPGFYGYKTKRSMKNEETWNYANDTANKLLGISILISILIYIILHLIKIPEKILNGIFFAIFTTLSILIVPIIEYLLYYKYYRNKEE